MAWSCGADGYAVGRPDNLRSALAEALRRRRPAVIDVPMANEPARARSGLGH